MRIDAGIGGGGVDRQRPLEIVDHGQQTLDEGAVGKGDGLILVGFQTAAGVLKIRGGASQAVEQAVAFLNQRIALLAKRFHVFAFG